MEGNAALPRSAALKRLRALWTPDVPLNREVWESAIPDRVMEPFLLALSPQATFEDVINYLPASIALAHAEATTYAEVEAAFYDTCTQYFADALGRVPDALLTHATGTGAGAIVLMRYLASADRPLTILTMDASIYFGVTNFRDMWLKNTRLPHRVVMHPSELAPTDVVDVVMCDSVPLYDHDLRNPGRYLGGLLVTPLNLAPDAVFFVDFTCLPLFGSTHIAAMYTRHMTSFNVVMYSSMHKLHMLGSDRVSVGVTAVFRHNNALILDCARALVTSRYPAEALDAYSLSYLTLCLRDPFARVYVRAYHDNVMLMYTRMQAAVPELCPKGLETFVPGPIPLPYVIVAYRALLANAVDDGTFRLWGPITDPAKERWVETLRKHLSACAVLKKRSSFGFRTPTYDHVEGAVFRISPGMHPEHVDVMVSMLRAALDEFTTVSRTTGIDESQT
jgi:hypothetical protein